jgi:hypothetical protein
LHADCLDFLVGQDMQNYLIKNISIVNEGVIKQGDVILKMDELKRKKHT